MANYNINYLVKDELIYELTARGQEICSNKVEPLRKQLRLCYTISPEVTHLVGQVKLQNEFEALNNKLDLLQLQLEENTETTSNLLVAKIRAKLAHLQLRIRMLSNSKLDATHQKTLDSIIERLTALNTEFDTVKTKIAPDELAQFETKLNDSILEEEEEYKKTEERLRHLKIATSTPGKTQEMKIQEKPQEDKQLELDKISPSLSGNYYTGTTVSIFNKLSNPVEKYVEQFTNCDGLEIRPLLKFLQNLVRIKKKLT